MKKFLMAATAAVAVLGAASAANAVVFTSIGNTTGNVQFVGFASGIGLDDDIRGILNLTLVDILNSGTQYKFSYSLLNNSVPDDEDSRIASFGFNIDPATYVDPTGNTAENAAVEGFFDFAREGNFVSGQPNLEFCATDSNNCNAIGNASGTVEVGEAAATGFFYLNFSSAPGTAGVTLSDLRMRAGSLANGNSGYLAPCSGTLCDGFNTGNEVPEPGTWALMILGFGAAGAMLRRRRYAIA